MTAYYNEIDPFAAAWLRELIKAGAIAPGEVDTRSIEDVTADDLRGFTQCHFFAGIGVWSYALRCAGWPDDRPVWTGSCPCQPFSAAGKRGGTSDERHLFPAWFHLISVCRPPTVFGEQVASKDGLAWLDLVHADLEGQGYAVGCLDLCAAGFGAPHIRQRLYFVAESCGSRVHEECREIRRERAGSSKDGQRLWDGAISGGPARLLADAPKCGSGAGLRDSGPGAERGIQLADRGELGDAIKPRLEGYAGNGRNGNKPGRQREGEARSTSETGGPLRLADPSSVGREMALFKSRDGRTSFEDREADEQRSGGSPCNGFWSDAVWLPCRDGKARPTQPGLFPLAYGAAARVGRLRGYGNAIAAPVAEEFIRAYMEVSHD